MLKRLCIIWVIIVVPCFGVHAERPAGIVLYFESGGEVFLLLADNLESDRGWGAFGGSPQEGENTAETAARETEEETRGYFLRGDLLNMIKDQEPVIDHNGFALYFAEIPFVPAQLVTNNPVPDDDKFYIERGPYAWIPYSKIEPHLEGPVNTDKGYPIEERLLPHERNTSWFWPVWLGNVRRAIETKSIPWSIK